MRDNKSGRQRTTYAEVGLLAKGDKEKAENVANSATNKNLTFKVKNFFPIF
jgi:hypothetical protein